MPSRVQNTNMRAGRQEVCVRSDAHRAEAETLLLPHRIGNGQEAVRITYY